MKAEDIQNEIIKWRRYLHQNPELSFEEINTSNYIFNVLSSFQGLEISRPTKTSVIATLKGKSPGKTVAFRADIDALPIQEEAEVSFKSTNNGIMHACGHDTHAAILLGAAKILSAMKDKFAGKIIFIFQHAEESPSGGAKEIIEMGILEGVDMIFGLHIMPNIPSGHIGIRKGELMAASDVVKIVIQGKGSHGSTPELSVNPIMIGAEIINNFSHIISNNISAFDNVVISVGEFSAGKAANIIPDTARIQASVRTNNSQIRMFIRQRIEEVVEYITKMNHASYRLDYIFGYSPLTNDEYASDIVINAAKKVVSDNNIFEADRYMSSEDFSAYTEKVKGAYFILGGGTAEEGCGYQNHHPKFCINESSLTVGTDLFVQIAKDLLL